jgi:DNA-binding SARP family transcriptional activator
MPELHLHGPPLVTLDDGRTLPLAAREAALLARLHRGGPAPRAALAGLLWPGGDEAKARANLRQTLVRLKRAFGALLAEHDGALRLAQGVRVAAMRGRLLGPLEFDDAPELAAWLAAERDAEQRDRLRLGLATARERIDAGDLDGALAAADALLADDPAVEEAHRLRMEVFYLRGDRAAALAAWDECRHALRQAFGVTPGEATNRLGREVLDSEAAPPRAAGAAPRLPLALRRPLRRHGWRKTPTQPGVHIHVMQRQRPCRAVAQAQPPQHAARLLVAPQPRCAHPPAGFATGQRGRPLVAAMLRPSWPAPARPASECGC